MTFRQFAFNHVLRNKRTYAAYFLSSAFSVMIFFVCAVFLFHPGLRQEMVYNSAVLALAQAETIMFLFCFFFVLYSVGSFLRSRKREFGILLLHGMTDRGLKLMIFYENMLIGTAAILCGISTGLLTVKLFLMAGSNLLGIQSLSFDISGYALLLTILAFTVLFLLISLCTSILLGSTRLIDLFQSGSKQAAPPQISRWKVLLAIVLIVSSYGLAATTTASTMLVRMLPVTLMTIIGTYFFYTELSVFIISAAKRMKRIYWHRTNLVTISNLANRMRDNAWMFFLVTIISTITFCSVGTFASISRLSSEFALDYPAAIAYVAKTGNLKEEQHLEAIKRELTARQIPYRIERADIIYTPVASSTLPSDPQIVPLISFSDYVRIISAAGYQPPEETLARDEALVLMGSEREKPLLKERRLAGYVLQGTGMSVREVGVTEYVAIPDYLMMELGDEWEGNFSGLVISDSLRRELPADSDTDRFTGFYVEHYEKTAGIAAHLTTNGKTSYDTDSPYALTVSGTLYEVQRATYSVLLFSALLVGVVFFIAAGSFLYFRLYSDLEHDRRQYGAMARIGVTWREIRSIATRQLGLLFFVPIGVAVLHSLFAFTALQSYFNFSIAGEAGLILAGFLIAQILYFFFIRSHYLRNLRKAID